MPGVTTDLVRHSTAPTPSPVRDITFPQAPQEEPSYYDLSFLKPPVWKWQITGYFFMGGLSAGAYLIARAAERAGDRSHRDVTRLGDLIAFAATLPCPPLLIADLGDHKRFHHMLRVWKPTSPMNLGSWVLTAYSGVAALAALRHIGEGRSKSERTVLGRIARSLRKSNDAMAVITDVAGIPLALMFSGYTGVLISCTANPLWCKNPWLGPMFTASGVGAAAGAISLALTATGHSPESPAHQVIEKIDTVANIAELATIAGFISHAGKNAEPLTKGKYKSHLCFGAASLVTAEVLKHLPVRGTAKKLTSIAAAALGIGASLSLKWAMTYAGHEAANNPKLARNVSRARTPEQEPRLMRTAQAAPAVHVR